jgi:hypothetical protein
MTDGEIKIERLLDDKQAYRDSCELKEMNGMRCGARQGLYLRGGYKVAQQAFPHGKREGKESNGRHG